MDGFAMLSVVLVLIQLTEAVAHAPASLCQPKLR